MDRGKASSSAAEEGRLAGTFGLELTDLSLATEGTGDSRDAPVFGMSTLAFPTIGVPCGESALSALFFALTLSFLALTGGRAGAASIGAGANVSPALY